MPTVLSLSSRRFRPKINSGLEKRDWEEVLIGETRCVRMHRIFRMLEIRATNFSFEDTRTPIRRSAEDEGLHVPCWWFCVLLEVERAAFVTSYWPKNDTIYTYK